jgi:hypothetical protein
LPPAGRGQMHFWAPPAARCLRTQRKSAALPTGDRPCGCIGPAKPLEIGNFDGVNSAVGPASR